MSLDKIKDLTIVELEQELAAGAKFVTFFVTFSILVMTFRRTTGVHFVRKGEFTLKYHWIYTLLTLVFGWWGFPWGPIYSIQTIVENLTGGRDVTQSVMEGLQPKVVTDDAILAKVKI